MGSTKYPYLREHNRTSRPRRALHQLHGCEDGGMMLQCRYLWLYPHGFVMESRDIQLLVLRDPRGQKKRVFGVFVISSATEANVHWSMLSNKQLAAGITEEQKFCRYHSSMRTMGYDTLSLMIDLRASFAPEPTSPDRSCHTRVPGMFQAVAISALGSFFAFAAYLNLNDPDWILWSTAYALGALVCGWTVMSGMGGHDAAVAGSLKESSRTRR